MLTTLSHWLQQHQLPCAYKHLFGISCPVCGGQRGLVALLNGNILEAIRLFPPILPLLATAVWMLVAALAHCRLNSTAFHCLLVADGIVLVFNFVYQNWLMV